MPTGHHADRPSSYPRRPLFPECQSAAVDERIAEIGEAYGADSERAWVFGNCFPQHPRHHGAIRRTRWPAWLLRHHRRHRRHVVARFDQSVDRLKCRNGSPMRPCSRDSREIQASEVG